MIFTATIEIVNIPSPDSHENNRRLIEEYLKYKGNVRVTILEQVEEAK